MIRPFSVTLCCVALVAFVGCSKDEPGTTASNTSDHTHDDGQAHDDGHNHGIHGVESAPAQSGAGHAGPVIELGTTTIGQFTVRASRDAGAIKAGGDAPIDVWLTPGNGGDIANVTAVRFWIGVESSEGSVKAKADIEDPTQPNHWHTHAEVPNPMPAGAKLWVEIETEGRGKQVGTFELKA